MNAMQYNQQENYYTTVNGIKVYVDYANERLKILDYQCISEDIIQDIINFSKSEGLGKLISNCRIRLLRPFRSCGFAVEGIINGFFQGEDAYCISYFLDLKRQVAPKREEEDSILYQCVSDRKRFSPQGNRKYTIREANISDIPQMIKLFSTVFETYPSPVFSVEYLKKVMNEHVLFKVAEENGKIVSIASADMDKLNLNAEITDCATYPERRGQGILPNLICSLEADLKEKGFRTAYSLSRAVNPGINKALSRLEYKYSGRLVNNCHICGGYEDMNIWGKSLIK